MIFVLAYPEFAPETATSIRQFRLKHEPERANLVAPHITLVFGLRTVEPQDFLPFCARIFESVPAIPVAFPASEVLFDAREKTHKRCLLCSTGSERLAELHRRLYQGAHRRASVSEFVFRPHMTIATHANLAVVQDLDLAPLGPLPLSAVITAVDVVKLANGALQSLRRFSLTG